MTEHISANQPELRALAELARMAPSKLAAALNDPDPFPKQITREEIARYMESSTALLKLAARVNRILTAAITKAAKARRN